MRCWKKALERIAPVTLALAVAGCADFEHPTLGIEHALRTPDGLRLELRYRPSAEQLAALDDGVPLSLRIELDDGPRGRHEIILGLRHFPLSRRYQLHVAQGNDASFALRGYLFAALENLSLALPPEVCASAAGCTIRVRQDDAALPGALRLPALILPAWRLPVARAHVASGAA